MSIRAGVKLSPLRSNCTVSDGISYNSTKLWADAFIPYWEILTFSAAEICPAIIPCEAS